MGTTFFKNYLAKLIRPNRRDLIIEDLTRQLEVVNQRSELFFNATGDVIWDWDMVTDAITWNNGRKTMLGYNDLSFTNNFGSYQNYVHPEDKEEFLDALKNVLDNNEEKWYSIYRYRCANGLYKFIYNRGQVLYQAGKAVRLIGAMQDIDERMAALQEVEMLSLVASKTENLVIITDAEEKIEWVNAGFVKRMGYSLVEMIGKTPRMLQGPETDLSTLKRIREGIDAAQSVTEEILNYTKDGQKVWLKININPVFDDTKKLIRLIAVETDLTDQKENENKIKAVAADLADLIENANAIIFGIDKQGKVNEWNSSATVAIGYSKHEVMGEQLTKFLFDPKQKENIELLCQTVLDGNRLSLQELSIVDRVGKMDTLLVSATPRRNPTGEIVGMLAVGQDITELIEYRTSLEEKVKERTKKLELALIKEKELVELKNQFVAIASHEFRTPLATINFATNFLNEHFEELETPAVRSKLERIEKQVLHMTSLLDDVIMAGRTELNKIATSKSIMSLRPVMNKILEEVLLATKNTHQINFNCEMSSNEIATDEKLLRNILINLLTNAIKFSPDTKGIDFHVFQKDNSIIFEVADKGIGIPDEDQNQLFVAFQRGSNTKAIAGTGLGLTIVKKAVDVLNGTLLVESKINQGTTVKVTLPIVA